MSIKTLDEALADIARRSFYEDAVIRPVTTANYRDFPLGYVVEDDYGTIDTESLTWTYDDGINPSGRLDEYRTQLMDPCQTFRYPENIRIYLPEVEEALTEGKTVHVAYAPVEDEDAGINEYGEIEYAGWGLIARIVDEED